MSPFWVNENSSPEMYLWFKSLSFSLSLSAFFQRKKKKTLLLRCLIVIREFCVFNILHLLVFKIFYFFNNLFLFFNTIQLHKAEEFFLFNIFLSRKNKESNFLNNFFLNNILIINYIYQNFHNERIISLKFLFFLLLFLHPIFNWRQKFYSKI